MKIHDRPLAFVDVETTGGSALSDRIIEIGIIRVEDGAIVKTLDTLVNPLTHIPPMITQMTGIHGADVARAPLFDDISASVAEILDGAVFVAHNARFDYGFVKNEFARIDGRFNAKTLCTVRLSRRLFPGLPSYSLANLITHFNLEFAARHRAYDDAYCSYQLIERGVFVHGLDTVREHVDVLMKGPTLPSGLSKLKVKNIPETAGVYKFLSDKSVLYIGKSVSLRGRVMNHFSSDYKTATDSKLGKYATDVVWRPTAGEIGALIRESEMIKTESPIYNRVLRRRLELVVLFLRHGDYLGGDLRRVSEINPDDVLTVLGVFKSLGKAREQLYELGGEYRLCLKLLGLEKSKGSCFNYKLGRCDGACLGQENKLAYNIRHVEAFSNLKIVQWPFDSAVKIVESGNGLMESHYINKWCYLGSLETNEDNDPVKTIYKPRYDHDIYKILAKRILKNHQRGIVKVSQEELVEFLA